ncbi:MAG: hypothetical protein JRH01_04245 [Deltaproteobacteria bacterium]|nr:hypothetical protein [Deltaproteobacteria bacterium]MBW2395656.1 hypothetical protein [Deltaproteobacteria bacterium]
MSFGLAIFAISCVIGAAAGAQARTEQLRWQHGNPAVVAGFTVHLGTKSGVYSQQIDAGTPVIQNGAYVFNLNVLDGASLYFAISARGTNGLTSPLSNERFRAAPQAPPPSTPLGTPGKPLVVSP